MKKSRLFGTALAVIGATTCAAIANDTRSRINSFDPELIVLNEAFVFELPAQSPVEPGFGVRGDDCTGTACQGNIAVAPAAAGTFADLAFISSAGAISTQRKADNFSVTESGEITQLCILGVYATNALGVAATPATATWRVRYYPDAGGFPCSIPRAEFVIGATNPTAGTSVSVDNNVGGGLFHRFTFAHPPVAVSAGECMWMEVVDVDPLATVFFFLQLTTGVTDGDGRLAVFNVGGAFNLNIAYPPTSVVAAGEPIFCVNVGTTMDTTTDCGPVSGSAPPNDNIFSPETLTIGAAPVSGATTNAQQDFARPCGFTYADVGGLWYEVIGNGNRLTVDVSTTGCSDPRVVVYDATGFDDPMGGGTPASLICVGDDDDGGPGLSSSLTFCSGDGTRYLVFVMPAYSSGFLNFFSRGPFSIGVTSGDPCDTPDGQNCDVTMEMDDVQEQEFCGGTSNNNCSGAATNPAEPYTIGDTVFGTLWTSFATSRDTDSYSFTISPTNRELVLTYRGVPAVINISTCSGTGTAAVFDGLQTFYFTCEDGETLRFVLTPNNYALRIFPNALGGLEECGQDYMNYRFTIVDAVAGACCVGDQCSISTEVACGDSNGVFQGEGSTCDPDPCAVGCNLTFDMMTDTLEAETCRGIALTTTTPSLNGTCATAQAIPVDGDTIFGNLSTNVIGAPNGVGVRDVDLFSFTLTETTDVSITLTAEADAVFGIAACPAGTFVVPFQPADACQTTSDTFTLDAGSYAVVVASAEFTGLPCTSNKNDYRLIVSFGDEPLPCPGDYNDDGVVDLADLLAFLGDWNPNLGQSGMGLPGDINDDGVVDLADLLQFLGDWNPNLGSVCP
ncbi:MAG: hypothetical protein KF768_09300 [Phycisphaeraceae bacterium]|nr:hypothetical protein [Phycisphaeraceae bacterium]